MTTETTKEYAIALFTLAVQENIPSDVYEGLTLIKNIFEEQPETVALLDCHAISKSERLKIINDVFANTLPKCVTSFLCILCEKREVKHFSACVNEYEKLYLQSQKVATATVTSAVNLTDEQKQKILNKLQKVSGCKVVLNCVVDSSIIGGLSVDMDGIRFDGTVKTRLSAIKGVISQ